ncbi:MAG: valine--pyruvate transaminase [Armatimonadetes bacterium]|nr:valine--pyruvate transaminase [Armatimonadota bacterium]
MDSVQTAYAFSDVGAKFTRHSGILELMDDLGRAMTIHPDMLMLGGGNPAAVPQMQALWREQMNRLMADGDAFDRLLANYNPPQGNPHFVAAFAAMLQRELGWPVGPEHVVVTSGEQSGLFFLFNLLAGRVDGRPARRILLPMAPEYIGYADQGLSEDMFVTLRPTISWPHGEEAHIFKYHLDLDAVADRLAQGDIAAVAISRPCNPTGNVLDHDELIALTELTERFGVLLIVDGAYGVPFPGIVFGEAEPHWAPHVVHTFSLSKLGLPGTRTGIIVGPPEITAALGSMVAIVGLANSNLGQQLVLPLVESGELLTCGPKVLRPFYAARSLAAQNAVREFVGERIDQWAMHESQGAFFLWLWLRGLPITTRDLYQRLKERGVLVVPGEYFFYGLAEPWAHQHECLRVSFAQAPEVVREGIRLLGEELSCA